MFPSIDLDLSMSEMQSVKYESAIKQKIIFARFITVLQYFLMNAITCQGF